MFTAYNPPLISPVPSTSRTCSLNPPKGPLLIAQTFAKGLPCARPKEHCGRHHPTLMALREDWMWNYNLELTSTQERIKAKCECSRGNNDYYREVKKQAWTPSLTLE